MPTPLVRNFAGGEVTPEMFGRFDLAKQQTGLALCQNFEILPHGVAESRAGFEFIAPTRYSNRRSRIVQFNSSALQDYAIELGHGYFRVHIDGEVVKETPLSGTSLQKTIPVRIDIGAHTLAVGDTVYVDNINSLTEPSAHALLNDKFFTVLEIGVDYVALGDPVSGAAIDGTVLTDLDLTATSDVAKVFEQVLPYQEADLFELVITQSNDTLKITHTNYPPAKLTRVDTNNWTYEEVQFLPTISSPAAPTVSANNPAGPLVTTFYKATAVAAETLEESLPSPALSVDIGVTQAGGFCDIQMPSPVGAIRVNLYKLFNGLYAFAGQTVPGGIIRDDNIAPDVDKTAPFLVNPFNGVGNYPGANGSFENREIFAATLTRQQSYWMTASNTESNLSYSIPTQDDDAITGTLRGRKRARIRHIVPLSNLVFLTDSGEWKFAPVNSDILTPDSAFPKQDSEEGCSTIPPVVVGSACIFVPGTGTQLRRLEYKWQQSGWGVSDLSVLAPHLFRGKTLVDLAFLKSPHQSIQAVRSDGVLLPLTYHPEHEVTAWQQFTTLGSFESVASVKEGNEHLTYAIINRTINGQTARYVERRVSRLNATAFNFSETFYSLEAQAVFAAWSPPPSDAQKDRINGMIEQLKAWGIWDKLDVFFNFMEGNQANTLVNWKNPAHILQPFGLETGKLTFVEGDGWQGNNHAFNAKLQFESPLISASDMTYYTQTDASMGCYIKTPPVSFTGDFVIGSNGPGAQNAFQAIGSGPNFFPIGSIQDIDSFHESFPTVTSFQGLFSLVRTSSTAIRFVIDDGSVYSVPQTEVSGPPSTDQLTLLRQAAQAGCNHRISGFFMGASFTDAELGQIKSVYEFVAPPPPIFVATEIDASAGAVCVDSAVIIDGPDAISEVYGGSHLAGETVAILADGSVHPNRTVDANGHITLDYPARVIRFGLPYKCRLQTIPPALERAEGFGQHARKNVDKVHVRLHETVTLKAGPSFDKMRQISPRGEGEDWDEPARPKSKIIEIPVDGDWNVQGQVCIEQDLPLPATVLGLVVEMASEGSS